MENEYQIERTFQVDPGGNLDIRNINGSTQIESWDRQEIRVLARKGAKSAQADEATQIQISQEGNTVYVKTQAKAEGDWLGWLGTKIKAPARVDYLVKAPVRCNIATSMVSGRTTVAGFEGGLRLNTVSGDANVAGISGKISFNTVSGDIEAAELAGDVQLNSVSGDVVIKGSNLFSLKGNTVSGDLRLETPLSEEGRYATSAVSGDVRFTVPADTGCTAKLSTLSGDLRTDLPHTVLEGKRTAKRYEINGGGAALEANSLSGDLRIMAAATGAPPPPPARGQEEAEAWPEAPEEAVAGSSRMEILRAIESGEITVQEGLSRLADYEEEGA